MQIKKETWILLALLGFGLYRHVMAKKQTNQNTSTSDQQLDAIFRASHDKNNGDPIKVVTEVQEVWGNQYGYTKDQTMQRYEIFRQRLQEDPNTGL